MPLVGPQVMPNIRNCVESLWRERIPLPCCLSSSAPAAHLERSGGGSRDSPRNGSRAVFLIRQAFVGLLDHLEGTHAGPADTSISETLESFDEDGVHRSWSEALDRAVDQPDGAITAARTLLETVCKSILDTKGDGAYAEGDDLPKLYFKTAEYLNLAPSQHTEETFKAILGSCQNVVNSLGTLRNRIGDAHGQGRRPIRPSKRHAALAVNLAGAMATFLVQTYADKKSAS